MRGARFGFWFSIHTRQSVQKAAAVFKPERDFMHREVVFVSLNNSASPNRVAEDDLVHLEVIHRFGTYSQVWITRPNRTSTSSLADFSLGITGNNPVISFLKISLATPTGCA